MRRAWRETASAGPWSSRLKMLATIGGLALAAFVAWQTTKKVPLTVWSAFLGAVVIVAMWFIYKLVTVPVAMHAEQQAEIERLQPKSDAPRISLIDAIRYLVEESVWTGSLVVDEDDIHTLAIREIKDKLELGRLQARGREVRNDIKDHERGPKDIPSGFWPGAEFDMLRILSEPIPSTLIKNDATGWQDVTVLTEAVRDAWRPLPAGQLSTNVYALAGRQFRSD